MIGLRRIGLMIITFLGAISLCYAQSTARFATEKLEGLAAAIGFCPETATAGKVAIPAAANHKQAYARVDSAGVVCHIGYPMFDRYGMSSTLSEISDFLERSALEQALFANGTLSYAPWEFPGAVEFVSGSWDALSKLCPHDKVTIACDNVEDRQCQIAVYNDSKEVCQLYFPLDYSLISGAFLKENEQKLVTSLLHANATEAPEVAHGPVVYSEEHAGFVSLGHPLQGSVLQNILYYSMPNEEEDATPQLIFTQKYPIESISNVLSSTQIDTDLQTNVVVTTSDGRKTITMPLHRLIDTLLSQGCTPYVGVYDFDREKNEIAVMVKMYNRNLGYMHLLKVDANIGEIFKPGGCITVSMHPFITPPGPEPKQLIEN